MPCSSLVEAGDGASQGTQHRQSGCRRRQAVRVLNPPVMLPFCSSSEWWHGCRMNTKMLLTHFSTCYPRMPMYLSRPGSPARRQKSSSGEGPVMAPMLDHAWVRVGDMWKLRAYVCAIEQSFHDTFEGDSESVCLFVLPTFSHQYSRPPRPSHTSGPHLPAQLGRRLRHIKMVVVTWSRDIMTVLVQHGASLTVAYGHNEARGVS